KIAGIEVPPRAHYLRVLAAELNRIASHLVAVGTFGLDLGAFTYFCYAFREREMILQIFERLCGARLTYSYIRLGGVMRDLDEDLIEDIKVFLHIMESKWPEYNQLLTDNEIFIRRAANVGAIPPDRAVANGLTGPCLRGSGVRFDCRKAFPYSGYEQFEFDVPIGQGQKGTLGDVWDRYWVRMQEILQSIRICRQVIGGLPEGPVISKVPRALKIPEGVECYVPTENPRGELGFYVIGGGKDVLARCRVRAPSFCNLSIANEVCRDVLMADIVAILGSFDIVLGEVDR
ncbi:MAG: NADH-quinone oxidoreductase subunit D, partial [Candidatus Sumerlaeota bacterium]|nr:NADH-quinone oxidoreductase subunit D [Candidatus Sumerlaeota bacterium]